MSKPKRIFIIADFKEESPQSIQIQQRMWVKGLLRLGHDVQRFSYRNIMMQVNPFSSKNFFRKSSKKKADECLIQAIKAYRPHIILVLTTKYIDEETIQMIRKASRNTIIIGMDGDPYPDQNPARVTFGAAMDIFFTTGADNYLRTYKDAGIPVCAFVPNLCDPDIQYRYEVEKKWQTDFLFTGKPEHTRLEHDSERTDLVNRFSKLSNVKIYGAFGVPRVEGLDYFYALSGAKIGLSINIDNNERLYHSDRFINYVSCGLFTLARRVPDTELMFEDNVHVRYFESEDEFFDLAGWYLKHDQERDSIALAGMERAHSAFNCATIAQHLLDIVDNGAYEAPWAVVL